jgi:hypothetical protein
MRILILVFALAICSEASSQSKTTESLHKKYNDALSLFFYNNTLRMLNQNDDKDFDELIKDIEKMKFLMIDKAPSFGSADYKKITAGYKGEAFEEIMTSRYEGKNFDVFLKEKSGKTLGMVVLVNDSASLYVLDIVGSIALDKVTSLYNTLDQSSDVGKKIKSFTDRHNKKEEDGEKEEDDQ